MAQKRTSKSHGVTQKRVITIGGGTGTFPVVQALRQISTHITCVVAVSDSGGSTGRIRDEFGFQPVGDLRQALAALARLPSQTWIQQVLLYRFSKGSGLTGHNLGNLILTALQDMTETTTDALAVAKTIFHLEGQVLPVTDQEVTLKTVYADGTTIFGEHRLDEASAPTTPIDHVELIPQATCTSQVAKAIREADHIIIGPGDLFASLLAVLVVNGVAEAFSQSKARVTYVVNLMTRRSQTANFTAANHVQRIEEALRHPVNHILLNTQAVSPPVLSQYQDAGEAVVVDDLGKDRRVTRQPLMNEVPFTHHPADELDRSLIRHDSQLLLPLLKKILSTS